MKNLPIDVQLLIFNYLDKFELIPYDKLSKVCMFSNEVWKIHFRKDFNKNESINYYEEYKWEKRLEKKRFMYKRQFTLGCVGKIKPLEKPIIKPAIPYRKYIN
tara:strand:- start:144 stop:452 length:309 start_codon:yes stop_codon:yes gene_type:complete